MELSSATWYAVLIAIVGVERLAELVISRRNARWAFQQGGREYDAEHFPFMAALHSLFLVGAVAEVVLLRRPFVPQLGFSMLALAILAQGLRYWAIVTLGRRWNVKVIVVPDQPAVDGGPYRWLRHPNYLAVIVEGIALPLVHGAWITLVVFSTLNLWLLRTRIRVEERALAEHNAYDDRLGSRARIFPGL